MKPSTRHTHIGLDRLVRLRWLERTAYLMLAGNHDASIKQVLQEELKDAFRSANTQVRGSLDKTITVLLKIWVRPPADLSGLHRDGLKLLARLPREEHVAVHWGMIMAAYPFWGAVAGQVGRLLRLQGDVATRQVQRRLREQYGERETVSRRVRYVLRSFVEWGVLQETGMQGVYKPGNIYRVTRQELTAWMAEAVLHAHPRRVLPIDALFTSTTLFPFAFGFMTGQQLTELSPRLEVLRHGLDEELVLLNPTT